jgi:hypothetical protein
MKSSLLPLTGFQIDKHCSMNIHVSSLQNSYDLNKNWSKPQELFQPESSWTSS